MLSSPRQSLRALSVLLLLGGASARAAAPAPPATPADSPTQVVEEITTKDATVILVERTPKKKPEPRVIGFTMGPNVHQAILGAGWELAVPIGSLTNFINAVSPAGINADLRIGLVEHVSLGASFSWNRFYQNFSNLELQFPGLTVNGPVYRELQAFTARATSHYYFQLDLLQLYAGLGIGVVSTRPYEQVADFITTASTFNFAIAPEAGILLPLGRSGGINVLVRYQFTAATFLNVSNAQWFTLQVGAYFAN
jgi:hypothetical protein